MNHFTRHSFVGTTEDGGFYVTIEWMFRNNQDELSVTGVVGPKSNGDAVSCGQTGVHEIVKFAAGWDAEMAAKLAEIWDRWHLNGMRAGSPNQEAFLRANPVNAVYPESHYDKAKAALRLADLDPDPEYMVDGDRLYFYGSKWLYEEVPADVLTWLHELPDNAQRLPDTWR